jgi:hypothetical protein
MFSGILSQEEIAAWHTAFHWWKHMIVRVGQTML